MPFHLGKPVLVMLLIALVSGVVIAFRPKPRQADLTVWVFADPHARTYRGLAPVFESATGRAVDVKLIGNQALDVRLTSLFMSGAAGDELPDLAEIEINSVGRYFSPPADQVAFLPLNDFLHNTGLREIRSPADPGKRGWRARLAADHSVYTHDGNQWVPEPIGGRARPDAWIDRIVRSRLETWSKDGRYFGIPHDVHPVTITYREDLFREAGVDLSTARTWPDFHDRCLRLQEYWRRRGYPNRRAIELPSAEASHLSVMLAQRRIELIPDDRTVRLADPKVAQTIGFYARLVAGPGRIAGESAGGAGGAWTRDLAAGDLCAAFTPDWRAGDLRQFAADSLRGKLRMMALPKFDESDAPTAAWGGTMIGIPRNCPDPAAAWRLIELLYLSDAGLDARAAESDIVPPLIEYWDRPAFHAPDPFFFGNQKVGELYVGLAAQVPPRRVSAVSPLASTAMNVVLGKSAGYVRSHGTDGLEAAVMGWLREAERDIRRRVEHATYEPK